MKDLIIDIREREEYQAEFIEDSINMPLSNNEDNIIKLIKYNTSETPDKKIILMCKSGKRSEMLFNILPKELKKNIICFKGGIDLYENKTTNKSKTKLSLFRQVMVAIGLILLTSFFISYFVFDSTLSLISIVSILVGSGTLYAGLSGNCLMMYALKLMPWNGEKSHEK